MFGFERRMLFASVLIAVLVIALSTGFIVNQVEVAISAASPSADSARPTNPAISDDRAVEIARDYIGLSPDEPGGRINFTMSYRYGHWVWRFWLSGNNGGLFHIDVETGEVLLFKPDAPIVLDKGSAIVIDEGASEDRSNETPDNFNDVHNMMNRLIEFLRRVRYN